MDGLQLHEKLIFQYMEIASFSDFTNTEKLKIRVINVLVFCDVSVKAYTFVDKWKKLSEIEHKILLFLGDTQLLPIF